MPLSTVSNTPTLTEIHLYPVKSLRGFSVPSANITRRGLEYDRRFMVVDSMGEFLTIRERPAMATVKTSINGDKLILSNAFDDSVAVPLAPLPGPLKKVRVWSSTVDAHEVSDEANALLSETLETDARLVYMPDSSERALKAGRGEPGDIVSFADGYPLLIATEASLIELNRRIVERGGKPVPMNRFRTNLVVTGAPAFAEDALGVMSVGGAGFRAAKPCVRCQVTTTDQITGEVLGPEPLATLATFRDSPDGVRFGTNLIPTGIGALRVGDPVSFPV
jgi:uncharacterized protein